MPLAKRTLPRYGIEFIWPQCAVITFGVFGICRWSVDRGTASIGLNERRHNRSSQTEQRIALRGGLEVKDHDTPRPVVAPVNGIPGNFHSIEPAMLRPVELDQRQIDTVLQGVSGARRKFRESTPLNLPK